MISPAAFFTTGHILWYSLHNPQSAEHEGWNPFSIHCRSWFVTWNFWKTTCSDSLILNYPSLRFQPLPTIRTVTPRHIHHRITITITHASQSTNSLTKRSRKLRLLLEGSLKCYEASSYFITQHRKAPVTRPNMNQCAQSSSFIASYPPSQSRRFHIN